MHRPRLRLPGRRPAARARSGSPLLIDTQAASPIDPPVREVVHLTAAEETTDPLFGERDHAPRLVGRRRPSPPTTTSPAHGSPATSCRRPRAAATPSASRSSRPRPSASRPGRPRSCAPGPNASCDDTEPALPAHARAGPARVARARLVALSHKVAPDSMRSSSGEDDLPLPEIARHRGRLAARRPRPAVALAAPAARRRRRSRPRSRSTRSASATSARAWRRSAARRAGSSTATTPTRSASATASSASGPPDRHRCSTSPTASRAGAAGNVAADTITGVDPLMSAIVAHAPRTRSPRAGGADEESLDDVRSRARRTPSAPASCRAVRAEDYDEAAESLPWVLDAGTTFRWTGSWLTVFTTAQPKGGRETRPSTRSSARRAARPPAAGRLRGLRPLAALRRHRPRRHRLRAARGAPRRGRGGDPAASSAPVDARDGRPAFFAPDQLPLRHAARAQRARDRRAERARGSPASSRIAVPPPRPRARLRAHAGDRHRRPRRDHPRRQRPEPARARLAAHRREGGQVSRAAAAAAAAAVRTHLPLRRPARAVARAQPGRPAGQIAYRVGDFGSFRHDLAAAPRPGEQRARDLAAHRRTATSRCRSLDWWAYLADILTFYNERIANEATWAPRSCPRACAGSCRCSATGRGPASAPSATLAVIAAGAGAAHASRPASRSRPRRSPGRSRRRSSSRRARRSRNPTSAADRAARRSHSPAPPRAARRPARRRARPSRRRTTSSSPGAACS